MNEADELVVDVSDLRDGDMKVVERGGVSVLVCRAEGEIYAVENRCSHADVPLSDGSLDGCELECILHGAVFDVRNGEAVALPAREPIRSFPVSREADRATIRLA